MYNIKLYIITNYSQLKYFKFFVDRLINLN